MPEKLQFFPIDVTYRVNNGKAVIYIAGRTIDGKQVIITDDSFEPYFYIIAKNSEVKEKLLKIKVEIREGETASVIRVEEAEKNFMGKEVKAWKVFTSLPRDIPNIQEVVKGWDMVEATTEYDVLFVRRYLIDKGITPMTLTEAEGDFVTQASPLTFAATAINNVSEDTVQPHILAFDIETYSKDGSINAAKNPILMIAFHGKNFNKVISWKRIEGAEQVESEAALIEKFVEIIKAYKPDILTGYYSDGFDMPYIEARARKYKVKLDLGIDGSEININKRATITTTRIFGIAHVDIFKFIRRIGQLDTDLFGLDEVASELLGEKKIKVDMDQLSVLWDASDKKLSEFVTYNLHDAVLTYKLTEKMLSTLTEMVKIVGLPLFDINRMGYSQLVEWYLLRNESQFNELAPDSPNRDEVVKRRMLRAKGAFVFEPKPGLYEDIAVFDFRSLYPSIISSHNISPATLNCSCCEDKAKKVPIDGSDFWFCTKKKGFVPTMMDDLIKRRMRIKEIIKEEEGAKTKGDIITPLLEARLHSLKLLANSFYGYLGFYGARWYSHQCVNAITAYGRYYIHKVIDEAEKSGFKVIYSDTDSVFLALGKKSKKEGDAFMEKINAGLPGVMELEYEGFYPRGIFVAAKAGPYGAKKKYALISEDGKLKIRGFETVRRNWSPIAKEVQENVLHIVLKENAKDKAFAYIQKIVERLRKKEVPNEKVIMHTQLQKEIASYDAIGPHVAVASRMKQKGMTVGPGSIIKYIVTAGKERIRDRAKLPEEVKTGEYDADYYINNQVIPAIASIVDVLGFNSEELSHREGQKKLGSFG
ncbi:MAG TPA: DNA-directed DNA polymerase [Candidatus Nanoarchaeia archaeon]|nr:DNA-directed DNA polymerase [Candidatus Nanoarchaeia archaeon]